MRNDLINKIRSIQNKEILNKINLYVDTLININNKTIADIYYECINSNFYTDKEKNELKKVYEQCLDEQQIYIDKIKKLKENDLILKLISDEIKENFLQNNLKN